MTTLPFSSSKVKPCHVQTKLVCIVTLYQFIPLPISKCLQVSTMFASLTAGLIKKANLIPKNTFKANQFINITPTLSVLNFHYTGKYLS